MTRPEMEATIRDARADVLKIWNQSADPEIKTLADGAYKRLSAVLRKWEAP